MSWTHTFLGGLLVTAGLAAAQDCPDYSVFSKQMHLPLSNGSYRLSYMRPAPACRTFNSSDVEHTIAAMNEAIADPDLYRLFSNAFPNTLDTAIRWRGVAADDPDEELTFVITGDIDAMWLRDSANQMQSYRSLLSSPSSSSSNFSFFSNASPPSGPSASPLASLYRGVINLQARYLLQAPFCNSFQPPVESGLAPATNTAAAADVVTPPYRADQVFECKFELDSLAAFFEISADYYAATADAAFFARFHWLDAVRTVLATADAMRSTPTYDPRNGSVLTSPYTFRRTASRATETLANDGLGSPVGAGTGLVRSAFRPSDDSTLFQLLIPANMMFSRYLEQCALIVERLGAQAPSGLAQEMHAFAASVRAAVLRHGVVSPSHGPPIYAYEIDGFGSAAVMDDANIPSLLSAPLFGFTTIDDPLYRATRAAVLETDGQNNSNPYFMRGPVISSVGGPHQGPGMAWPMASIVRIMTSDDDDEIAEQLQQLVRSSDGLGLIHESINTFDAHTWTRQWFSWANGLFGQMILDLHKRKPGLLRRSYQK